MKYCHISSDGTERDVSLDDVVARDSIKSDMINLQKGNLDLPVEENEPSFFLILTELVKKTLSNNSQDFLRAFLFGRQ